MTENVQFLFDNGRSQVHTPHLHAGSEFGVAAAFLSFPTRSLLSRVPVFVVGNLHHGHIGAVMIALLKAVFK